MIFSSLRFRFRSIPAREHGVLKREASTLGDFGLGLGEWRTSGFGVYGSGFRVCVSGSTFRVHGLGFRVQGFGFWILDLGFKV